MSDEVLRIEHICKEFSGVEVLHDVSLSLNKGEILGLVGENGAGKSTLMKILSGIYQPNGGEIFFKGERKIISNPIQAREMHINMVQQELSLISTLSVQENIVLGCENRNKFTGYINSDENEKYANKALQTLDIDVDLNTLIKDLPVSKQQFIEISRNLVKDSAILILDEPTTSLNFSETEELLEKLVKLKENGTAIIFISHKLDEILKICDKTIVLRDGHKVASMINDETISRDKIIKHMVGDKGFKYVTHHNIENQYTQEMLKVKDLNKKGVFNDINFAVGRGEILGFFGLVGSGRTEVALSIFGREKYDSGKIYVGEKEVKFKTPADAIKGGLVYLTEDRKDKGIFQNMGVKENITASSLSNFASKGGRIFLNKEKNRVKENIDEFKIKTRDENQHIKFLSGGNQQKAILARCLLCDSKIVIVDEPTKGVDVGAKQEIYSYLYEITTQEKAVIMISSEIEEILAISDRIAVMKNGKISKILSNSGGVNAETIMHYAAG